MTRNQIAFAVLCFFLALSLVFMAPSMARAEGFPPGCGKTAEILKAVKNFREIPVGVGLNKNSELISVFVSEAGTFSIVVTSPNGTSCIRASGDSWEGRSLIWGRRA
jgi:hypothetical protein